jgi:hypothetical protein
LKSYSAFVPKEEASLFASAGVFVGGNAKGTAGIRRHQQPRLLLAAAQEWLEVKKPEWSPRMADIARTSMSHFLPALGKKLLVDIEASDISKYQKTRLAEGASTRTVNIEVGVLRQIVRKYGTWARIQPQVTMLRATRCGVGIVCGRGIGLAAGMW